MPTEFKDNLMRLRNCNDDYWNDVNASIQGTTTHLTLHAFLAAHEKWKASTTAASEEAPATRVLVHLLSPGNDLW